MNQLLKDQVAIITGGGSGIGRAAALEFAREGARIVVADIDRAGGEATVRQIGESALFVPTDVSLAADAETLATTALKHFGRIDILYNNAATTTLCNKHDRPVHELEEWVWDKMINVCLKGVFLCSKYALPSMIAQKSGVIINTTSVDALVAEPGFDSYTAAKGGVISMTRSMAAEYGKYGIRVNAISPGYVITECQDWYHKYPEARAKVDAMHLTRIGQPEDIAHMAVFLASDRANFITGATIPVDGGFTAFKGATPFEQSNL